MKKQQVKKGRKSRRGRRTTKRKKEMHPEMKESLKLSDKGSYYKQDDECLLLGIFGIFFSFT
jgi:hypothetical protein